MTYYTSTDKYDFDLFVIGAGSGGVRASRIASSHGARVGIAECSDLGGTCVNLGCVPKKLFAYGADFGFGFSDAKGYGWDVPEISFDWPTLLQNKDKEINRLNRIYEGILKKNNVELFCGTAEFVDNHTLKIGDKTVTADKILIATGGTPNKLAIHGAEHSLVSDDMFHLEEWPGKVAIIGGGYIAVEFAHIFHGMGCEVDILHKGSMILRGFDEDLRIKLCKAMRDEGINIHLDGCPSKIVKHGDGFDHNYCLHSDAGHKIECDMILAAIGRSPNTECLQLEKAGVELTKSGSIKINDDYQTSEGNIYAIGDVTDRINLTPVAIAQGHVLADNLFGPQTGREVDYENIPTAVFSHPPIGTVGMTECQAKEKGFDFDIYNTEFTPLIHQLSCRAEKTFMKLIVEKKTDKVIGLHILGRDAPEMLQGFAVAIKAGATKSDFDRTIPIHPTSAEELVTMRTPKVPAD